MQGIVVSTVGGTEAWHGDTNDTLSWQAQFIECLHTNEQGEGRVKTSRDTHYYGLAIGMDESLGQSHDLYFEYFFATLV